MESHLDRLRRELEDAIHNASSTELSRAPLGKWNTAQILEHLLLTYQNTNRGLAKCLKQGAPLATSVKLKDRLSTLLVLRLGYMPGGRKAPERVTPRGMLPEEARQAIIPELQKMCSALDDCEGKFGVAEKIMDHLFLGPLTADEWRRFHWVHGHHHARQIRERMGKS